uniref:Uncharacterized protein n=1 Tax=Pararge aegeria TaxID=116150 RepID=S4PYC1_9NEOP
MYITRRNLTAVMMTMQKITRVRCIFAARQKGKLTNIRSKRYRVRVRANPPYMNQFYTFSKRIPTKASLLIKLWLRRC